MEEKERSVFEEHQERAAVMRSDRQDHAATPGASPSAENPSRFRRSPLEAVEAKVQRQTKESVHTC